MSPELGLRSLRRCRTSRTMEPSVLPHSRFLPPSKVHHRLGLPVEGVVHAAVDQVARERVLPDLVAVGVPPTPLAHLLTRVQGTLSGYG